MIQCQHSLSRQVIRQNRYHLHVSKTRSYGEIWADGGESLIDIIDVLGLRFVSVAFGWDWFAS